MPLTKAVVQSAFAAIMTSASGSVVSVAANGNTASGVRSPSVSTADLGDIGERGGEFGAVRCDYDTIGAGSITRGQTITVGGTKVIVMAVNADQCLATARIQYTEQQPVTGVGGTL